MLEKSGGHEKRASGFDRNGRKAGPAQSAAPGEDGEHLCPHNNAIQSWKEIGRGEVSNVQVL